MSLATSSTTPGNWPMIGRDDEAQVVLQHLQSGGHAVLAGHAGVGKTTLSRYVAQQLAATGLASVRVKGTAAARSIPLGAFSTSVRDPLPAGAGPLELLMNVSEQLRAQSPDGLLLLVDDAHLLDPVSATLVGHLIGTGAVTLLATVRTGAECEDVIQDLWKDRTALRVELQALSRDEVDLLLHRVLDGEIARATVRWAFDTSEGTPLFLREIVEGALAQGSLHRTDGVWLLRDQPLPSNRLIDVVRSRMGTLDESRHRAMRLLALGEPLPLNTWQRLVDPAVSAALEDRGLVNVVAHDGPAEVTVGHPIYGEVVRSTTAPGIARALRIELAKALQATPSTRHDDQLRCAAWLLDAGDTPDAATLGAAARQAAAATDHRLAIRLARAALEQGDDLPLLLLMAASHRALGQFTAAEELLASNEALAARSLATDPDLARGYLFTRVATLHWGLNQPDHALALLDRSQSWTDHPAWAYAVRAQRAVVLSTAGQLRAAVVEGGALLADPGFHPAARLPLSVGHAFALQHRGRVEEALLVLDRAVAGADATDAVDWPPDAMWAIASIAGGVRWTEAADRLSRMRESALAARDISTAGYAELLLGRLELERGRPRTASAHLVQAEDHLSVQDSRRLMPSCRAFRVAALAMTGAHDDPAVTQWIAERSGPPDDPWIPAADLAQADVWTYAVDGQLDHAVRRGLAFAERCAEAPLAASAMLHTLVRVGHRPEAVLARLRAAAAACDAPIATARGTHVAGLAQRDPAALLTASEQFEAIGAVLCAAEAAAAAAGLLHQYGAPDSAAAAERALALRSGCENAATPGLRAAADAAGLTHRERQVASLAAQGLSNAQIADRLVLSSRTVESHLYRACGKLGVSRREDLAALLA